MRRSRLALAAVVLVVLGACSGGSGQAATTTTTEIGPTRPTSPTTTATTTAPTADPGFRTRSRGYLTVATSSMVPPFFESVNGQLVGGFEYDVAAVLAARLKVALRVRFVPLVAIEASYDCECDLYLGQVPATEVLARSTDLSEPYLGADQAVVVRAGGVIADRASARAMRWGTAMTNSSAVSWVGRSLQPLAALHLYESNDQPLAALRSGAVDAALLDAPLALTAVAADGTLALAGRIPTGDAYAAVLPLGSANTSALNDLIRSMKDDGTLALLTHRFLGQDPEAITALDLNG